jgi:hypothetical protein
MEAIARHLGASVEAVLPLFWASPGALVRDTATGREFMIPTITPRMRGGRCVFLDDTDRCTVHAAAPFGCAYADTHMPGHEWHRRAMWLYGRIRDSVQYAALRAILPKATSWRPR